MTDTRIEPKIQWAKWQTIKKNRIQLSTTFPVNRNTKKAVILLRFSEPMGPNKSWKLQIDAILVMHQYKNVKSVTQTSKLYVLLTFISKAHNR